MNEQLEKAERRANDALERLESLLRGLAEEARLQQAAREDAVRENWASRKALSTFRERDREYESLQDLYNDLENTRLDARRRLQDLMKSLHALRAGMQRS